MTGARQFRKAPVPVHDFDATGALGHMPPDRLAALVAVITTVHPEVTRLIPERFAALSDYELCVMIERSRRRSSDVLAGVYLLPEIIKRLSGGTDWRRWLKAHGI